MIVTPIELERLIQIESEREQTMNSPQFIEWSKQFNVGRLHESIAPKICANNLMNQYMEKYPKYIKRMKYETGTN